MREPSWTKHFDEVMFQPPSSPVISMLDAGIFSNMQAKVDKKNATTTAQIYAAVHAVWKEASQVKSKFTPRGTYL